MRDVDQERSVFDSAGALGNVPLPHHRSALRVDVRQCLRYVGLQLDHQKQKKQLRYVHQRCILSTPNNCLFSQPPHPNIPGQIEARQDARKGLRSLRLPRQHLPQHHGRGRLPLPHQRRPIQGPRRHRRLVRHRYANLSYFLLFLPKTSKAKLTPIAPLFQAPTTLATTPTTAR